MKKILVSMFLLIFGLCLVGCDNNKNKKPTISMLYSDWYNCSKLPSMQDPFAEIYDGSYTIKIDENNNVSFKTIDHEELNGKVEYEERRVTIDIKITFDDNSSTSSGYLSITDDSPYLNFFYNGHFYCFTKSKVISKEEFELYRTNFNKFLRDSFINDSYPTIEEVENNQFYREYTNFVHIDPCCNGPKIYTSVNKVMITYNQEEEITVIYSNGENENININEIENIILVKLDGTFERLDNIQDGQCFLTNNNSLFYFENIEMNIISLLEAYSSNKINDDQLQEIADIFNNHKGVNHDVYDKNLLLIKEKMLEEIRTQYDEATIDDIIVNVYWRQGTNYVVTITDSFTDYPEVEKELWINGVLIKYSGPKPVFVEINNK